MGTTILNYFRRDLKPAQTFCGDGNVPQLSNMGAASYMKLLSTWNVPSMAKKQNSYFSFIHCEGKMLQHGKLSRYLIPLLKIICDVARQWKFGEKEYLNDKSYFQTSQVHFDQAFAKLQGEVQDYKFRI